VGIHNVGLSLFCGVQARLCALPIENVLEIMRPLPIERLAGVPRFVRGLAVIRGAPMPVIDASCLLGGVETTPSRFVTMKAGERLVALAVDSVLGIRSIPAGSLRELPPVFRDAATGVVSAIGALDAQLLLVLQSARLVPDDLWASLGVGEGRT
jgi:purine-binding chemotaxis protein CheW